MSIHGLSIDERDMAAHAALAPLCKPGTRDSLLDRLCEVAHATPDHPAVVAADGMVTFHALTHQAYALARRIASVAPDEERPVAVESTGTVAAVTLMLAVIASGRALVPLDPKLPEGRRDDIVRRAGARRLDRSEVDGAQESAMPLPLVKGGRTALIAFTSGSTGAPKGVLLSHRMCLSKAYEVSSALGLVHQDRVGCALPISFGAGINTVLAGILSGATVYCRDPRELHGDNVIDWVGANSLTTLHCSPSLVRGMSAHASTSGPRPGATVDAVPSLRYVTTYGEPLHSRDVTAFRAESGCTATIVNWYATTEAGAVAHRQYRADEPLPTGFLAAGSAPTGKTLHIVRSDGALARNGETGQIRLTGHCFADGYLDLPDQTNERFTTDGGLRRYWTGDVGRIDETGALHLVGRVDDAVKIRGYQVEPAEIEGALRSIAGVADAFVMPHQDGPDTARYELTAFVVGTTPEADIRGALREKLPEWMMPKYVTTLDSIPRSERGKVDRTALQMRVSEGLRTATPSETVLVGATENWLALIVARELGLTSLHRDDDFAELGATSLVTTRILVEVRTAFHVELSPADLVDAMTVRRLAEVIDSRHASVDREKARASNNPVCVPLRSDGTGSPLFVVAGAGVPAIGLAPLAKHLTGRPVFALQARGLDTRALPHRTLKGCARAYVREIRRIQPHGPYTVAGHSLGAWIALEIADILRSHGETVERVVLLDPRLYRWVLDRLPGGSALTAAPPDPGNAVYKPSVAAYLRQTWRVITAGLVRYPTTERWLAFGIIGSMALRRHTPTPWDGPTTVVVTDSNTADRRSWEAVVTGDLDLTPVPGPHIGMVREPVVSAVADIVTRAMNPHRTGRA
ncbi:MAG: alpha/beta fold hydrolase [Rhodococcus sp. (in: high G+C Gram-positive bacteria)]